MSITLKTQRLILRRPNAVDAAPLSHLLDNFALAGNLARVNLPYRETDTLLWLLPNIRQQDPDKTSFVITHDGDKVIGHVGFHANDSPAVLGYWLGEPFWGRGLMSEAVTAALSWYFSKSDADIVLSGVFHFNMASLAIQHKLGFVETGRSEVHCLARKADIEHIDTELTREAFEAATR
jgi:RimJ/RimL family protein N-acetyltransferase